MKLPTTQEDAFTASEYYNRLAEELHYRAWNLYWRGLGPRPVPVDMEQVKRVAKQIKDHKS